jgi:PAS domain S-box-containing protein
MFGRTREEIVGKSIVEIMGKEAFETIRPYVEKVLSGQRVEYETEIPYQGVGSRFMHVVYVPDRNGQGEIVGWLATISDITELKMREAIREAIVSINQIIHSTLDFDEIMNQIVSEAAKVIESDSAAINLRKSGRWITSYVYGFPEDVIGTEISDEEEPHAVLAVKTRKPVAINDAFNDERVNRNQMKKWGIRSVLVVPLITRNKIIGALFFNYQKSTFEFDDVHVDFANQLASSISMALENSRLYENLKIELTERKQADEKLLKAYEQIKTQSEESQVFNEELQAQTEELRVTNEALQESERRFRTLAENSPDIIARFNRQNRHTYVNPAAAKVYGLSQEEMIGKTYSEMGRGPEQVRFLETYNEIVFATGKPETIEFQYTSPQGKEYYFNTKIVPEFVNGKITSILTISHDITGIKRTENKLKERFSN